MPPICNIFLKLKTVRLYLGSKLGVARYGWGEVGGDNLHLPTSDQSTFIAPVSSSGKLSSAGLRRNQPALQV